MRLWTLHPRYLDARGLVALWREALLAQKVLQGATRGYIHHPQLLRFRATQNAEGAIATYLRAVFREAARRGYAFDAGKIAPRRFRGAMEETEGQLCYEWRHLQTKLKRRDPKRHHAQRGVRAPEAHSLFQVVPGEVREWERGKVGGTPPPTPRRSRAATRSSTNRATRTAPARLRSQ
jgi:hypothetical protein